MRKVSVNKDTLIGVNLMKYVTVFVCAIGLLYSNTCKTREAKGLVKVLRRSARAGSDECARSVRVFV